MACNRSSSALSGDLQKQLRCGGKVLRVQQCALRSAISSWQKQEAELKHRLHAECMGGATHPRNCFMPTAPQRCRSCSSGCGGSGLLLLTRGFGVSAAALLLGLPASCEPRLLALQQDG